MPYQISARYGEQTGHGLFHHDALQTDWAETIQILGQTHTPPSERFILNVGGLLFDEVMKGGIRDLWVEARAAAQGSHYLRLRLDLHAPAVAALPWETLADPRRRRTLAADRSIALVRTATDVDFVERPRPLQSHWPVKILIVAAEEPGNIDAAREIERIRVGLAPRIPSQIEIEIFAGRFDIHSLRHRLQESRPDILHVISHGETDGLYLWEDEELTLVSASQLAATVALVGSIKLVFLNACLAGQPDGTTPFASLAQRLLQIGIPAVIAMQFEVLDRAAADFAGFLYEALVSGPCQGAIDVAVSIARSGLYISDPDRIDYATPLLWLNAPDGIILQLSGGVPQPQPEPAEANHPQPSPLVFDIEEKARWLRQIPPSLAHRGLRFVYEDRRKQVEKLLGRLRQDFDAQENGEMINLRQARERLAIFNDERSYIDNLLEQLSRSE